MNRKAPRRVWFLHHAESECVLKVYSEGEVEICVDRDQCDLIPFRYYEILRKKYERAERDFQGLSQ